MNDHKGIKRKSKLSSTIAQIKKDSTNIRQKSTSKPKSKSKGKVVTSKYNYESLNSPKPIEYSKVMKKFGNNIVSYREQPTTPKNNTITYELNDNIGSNVPSNYKEYYTANYNKDISDFKKSLTERHVAYYKDQVVLEKLLNFIKEKNILE